MSKKILKNMQSEEINFNEFDTWLWHGIDSGWVTKPFCNTHDGDPYMTEYEEQEWEAGGDPCQFVIKIKE